MILNLSPKAITVDQYTGGVREPVAADKRMVIRLHRFWSLPSGALLMTRAKGLVEISEKYGYDIVMIDAPGFFTPYIEFVFRQMSEKKIVYTFTGRYRLEEKGNVSSVICDHIGFIPGLKDATL